MKTKEIVISGCWLFLRCDAITRFIMLYERRIYVEKHI
jgi:hypothetical protein